MCTSFWMLFPITSLERWTLNDKVQPSHSSLSWRRVSAWCVSQYIETLNTYYFSLAFIRNQLPCLPICIQISCSLTCSQASKQHTRAPYLTWFSFFLFHLKATLVFWRDILEWTYQQMFFSAEILWNNISTFSGWVQIWILGIVPCRL